MPVDIEKKTWLADLVGEVLQGYDPVEALQRLPPELRGADPEGPDLDARTRALLVRSMRSKLLEPTAKAEDPFLTPIQGHVSLLQEIALVHGAPFEIDRRRGELAALFAANTGLLDLARAAEPAEKGAIDATAVQKAFAQAGSVLKARCHPPGDPKDGLPLHVGVLSIQRRHLARLAMSYYPQLRLDVSEARVLAEQANQELALLVEALAMAASAAGPLDVRHRRIAFAQVARLGLPRDLAREVREAVRGPRSAADLARATPVRARPFLLEQLLVADIAAGEPSASRAELVLSFAAEAGIAAEQVAALRADAAELYASQQRWLEGPTETGEEWETLAAEWEDAADEMMDKVAVTLTDNLEAIVKEIRQTGELGQLLAKATAGKTLTPDERSKVRVQLLDLAKAVPALAIFAAPGGMLLLPILAKVLPFNVLPSAWEQQKQKRPVRSKPTKKAGT